MIFKYLYYTIYNGYRNMGENQIPGFYAVGIITLLQYLPLYAIITIPYKLKYTEFKLDISMVVFFVFLLLTLNSLFYLTKNNNKKIMKSVEALNKKRLNFVRAFAVIYSCTAFLLVVILFMI